MQLPRFTPLPTPPSREQDGQDFADTADTFFDAMPGLASEFNDTIAPAIEDAANEAALEAAEEVSGMYNPNNYYRKTEIDSMLAAKYAELEIDSWFYRG